MRTRARRLLVLVTAVVVLSTFVGVASAAAGPSGGAATSVSAEQAAAPRAPIAPRCVERFSHTHIGYKDVHVFNGCPGTVYVKVIVAYGPDSACTTVFRSDSWTFRWYHGWPYALSRFDRLESC